MKRVRYEYLSSFFFGVTYPANNIATIYCVVVVEGKKRFNTVAFMYVWIWANVLRQSTEEMKKISGELGQIVHGRVSRLMAQYLV